jgi:hypothetical protein
MITEVERKIEENIYQHSNFSNHFSILLSYNLTVIQIVHPQSEIVQLHWHFHPHIIKNKVLFIHQLMHQ